MSHSQRLNDAPVRSWVIVGEDGDVETGHCECKAGLDECCSHIAAILFALLTAVKVISDTTCTSLPNSWYSSAGGKAEMAEGSNIAFINPKRQVDQLMETGELLEPTTIKTRYVPAPSENEISELHELIKPLGVKSALLSVLPGYAAEFQPRTLQLDLPQPLTDLFKEENMLLEKQELLNLAGTILPSISVTEDQVNLDLM